MKKTLSIAVVAVLLIGPFTIVGNWYIFTVQGATPVSGILTSDTTWTKADSPYDLTGNLLINQDATLAVEPGATVNLDDYYIMVNGTLDARGDDVNPIYFNGGQVVFTEFSEDWNESSGTGCIFENVILNSTITANNSLKISSGASFGSIEINGMAEPIISNNILRGGINVGGDGIITNNTVLDHGISILKNATVTNNRVSGSETGITAHTYFWDDSHPDAWPNSTALIEGNLITGNTNGIIITEQQGSKTGSPIIRNNSIINNAVGIYLTWLGLKAPDPTILNNNICNNSEYNVNLDFSSDVNASYNWWGTTNTSTIDQSIYDFYDDFNLGTVNYVPFLTEFNPNAPLVPSLYRFNVSAEPQSYEIMALSNSIISEFNFNQNLKELVFNAEGLPGTNGFCEITVPAELMSGTFSLYKDEVPLVKDIDYTESYNGTHYMFDILYDHSVHAIRIVSSQVVPDLPSNLLSVLIIISLSAATLFLKKKLLKVRTNQNLHIEN